MSETHKPLTNKNFWCAIQFMHHLGCWFWAFDGMFRTYIFWFWTTFL